MIDLKKKVILFGPIGDYGGRELETGFIAKSLTSNYEVTICSTGNLSTKSQVFDFVSKAQVCTLNDLVYEDNLRIRIATFFSWIKNKCKMPISFYVKSKFNKRFLNVDEAIKHQIVNQIKNSNCILICAQLSSNYVEFIINCGYQFEKPIFFRTTGTIKKLDENQFDYLKKVTQFIHHSKANAFNLNDQIALPYVIIDQCAYNEKALIAIKPLEHKVTTYITIARLEKEKNIEIVIEAFLKTKENGDQLYVVGDGIELSNLKKIASGEKAVIFTGFVMNKELKDYLKISDCVIISHYDFETGPLTGIEAMAAGKIIISAKTGAMPERLPNNKFWFDNSVDALVLEIENVKKLNAVEVKEISKINREIYQRNFSELCISEAYNTVFK